MVKCELCQVIGILQILIKVGKAIGNEHALVYNCLGRHVYRVVLEFAEEFVKMSADFSPKLVTLKFEFL